jgi:PAS domain S-box-containing protein
MENHAMVAADRSGTIRIWSSGAEKLFGYPAVDAAGKKLDLIVPDEYRAQHWAGFTKAMETGAAGLDGQSTEIPVKCRSGDITVFPASFMLLRDSRRDVIGAMVIFSPPG